MAARYKGKKPIKAADGRVYKHNDIIESITDEQARVLKQFEPVTETKKEFKKTYKESDDE